MMAMAALSGARYPFSLGEPVGGIWDCFGSLMLIENGLLLLMMVPKDLSATLWLKIRKEKKRGEEKTAGHLGRQTQWNSLRWSLSKVEFFPDQDMAR
jgi:hypothetical protein